MFVLVLALPVFADHISVYSAKPITSTCVEEAKAAQAIIAAYAHPDWSFIIACDDADWRTALTRAHIQAAPDVTYGATFLSQHVTLLRAAVYLARTERSLQPILSCMS